MPVSPIEQTSVERSLTIPPPVLGWNTKDPLSQMDPLYTPGIENYFPGNGRVSFRKGYTQHVKTTSGSGYAHLDEMVNNAGTHFLIGVTVSGLLYNDTSTGAGTAITGGFATQSPENYSVNFRGRLYVKGYSSAANSDMLSTDGTAATQPGFTGSGSDDKDFWRLATYGGRLYALTISDASMWYGGFEATTGAMTQWDWQSLLTKGGKPWYIGGFSMTGGDSTQEYFCMISEQGEVYLYQGNSPDDTTWGKVSHFFIPAPVGRKSFFNWGSDILIVTYDGLVSLKAYIGTPAGENYVFLTDNISSDFKEAIEATDQAYVNFIQGLVYPKGQYLLVNFYVTSPSLANTIQFVMNTQSRAWSKFTGQRAFCWSLLNHNPYWGGITDGGDSYIAKADDGYKDVDPSNSALTLTRTKKLRFAFNYFGNPSTRKRMIRAIPTVYQSEGLDITADVDVDYSDTTATSQETDTSKGTSYQIYQPELALNGTSGMAASFRIDGTATTKRESIEAVKIIYEEDTIE